MKGIIFGSCVLMGMVAFFAITDSGSAAELPQVIRISCAYNSATYGAGVIDCQPDSQRAMSPKIPCDLR